MDFQCACTHTHTHTHTHSNMTGNICNKAHYSSSSSINQKSLAWFFSSLSRDAGMQVRNYMYGMSIFYQLKLWFLPSTWTAARQASLSFAISQSLLKPMSIASVMPSNHLILCHPLLLLPSILPTIRVFSNESVLRITWPKYWSFSFSISPSNEYSGLISFRMDCFDHLAIQGTLKSLLQ